MDRREEEGETPVGGGGGVRQFQVQERAGTVVDLGFLGTALTVSVEVKCGVKVVIEGGLSKWW